MNLQNLNEPLELITPMALSAEFDSLNSGLEVTIECNTGEHCGKGTIKE